MANESNIYDLVEREAARRGVPRIELWQSVAKALVERRLVPSKFPNLSVPFINWLGGFKAAVDRHSDPNSCARILKHIIVRKSDFKKWLSAKKKTRKRGPEQGTTGLRISDENVVGQMRKLIRRGQATSPNSAASMLVAQIRGGGTPQSKAKRLIARYYEKYPKHR